MENYRFYSNCIYPTITLTGGKEYEVVNETEHDITIVNDKNNTVTVSRFRFDKIDSQKRKVDKNVIRCIDSAGFTNIQKDTEYKLVRESKTYYTIVNDKGYTTAYSKKYFKKYEEKEDEGNIAVKKRKNPSVSCLYPIAGELSFKKIYEYSKIDKTHVTIVDDTGSKKVHLVKRFKVDEK